MRSWQHNIEKVKVYNDYFLVSGETYQHNNSFIPTKWSFLINNMGELVTTIEPTVEFYKYTILDKCISKFIKENRLKLLLNNVTEDIVVYQTTENGEFSREI